MRLGWLMKNNAWFLLLLISSIISGGATAGAENIFAWLGLPSNYPWVATLSTGPVWNGDGKDQTFFLAPEIEKTYRAKQTNNALIAGEIFLGLRQPFNNPIYNPLQAQFGLALATTGNAKLSGDIWDDADPQFNNFHYHYKIRHTVLALKGILLADLSPTAYCLIPWISASMGIGFNTAHAFHNTPTIFEAVPNSNFKRHTEIAFSYTLGIGVEKSLTSHWQAGVGYEFSDWGRSKLNRAEGQTLHSGLRLNHLYNNGVLFNITYLA